MSTPLTCCHCGAQAADPAICCEICEHADLSVPKYGDEQAVPFYCTDQCKVNLSPSHADECGKTQLRLALVRAATLLQEGWVHFRKSAFPRNYEFQVYDEEKKVIEMILYSGSASYLGERNGVGPVGLLHSDASVQKAVLTWFSCIRSVIYSYPLIMILMHGIMHPSHKAVSSLEEIIPYATSILDNNQYEEVDVEINEDKMSFRAEATQRHDGLDQRIYGGEGDRPNHKILKILLDDHSVWALDMTGSQYGFLEAISPWHEYTARVNDGDMAEDATETWNYQSTFMSDEWAERDPHLELPGTNTFLHGLEAVSDFKYLGMTRAWLESKGHDLRKGLFGSQTEFSEMKADLMARISNEFLGWPDEDFDLVTEKETLYDWWKGCALPDRLDSQHDDIRNLFKETGAGENT